MPAKKLGLKPTVRGTKKELNESKVVTETNQVQDSSVLNLIDSVDSKNSEMDYPFIFRKVPVEKIIFSEDNDFDTSEMNCRRQAISVIKNQLINTLGLNYDLESDTYTMLSGEKRLRGFNYLKEDFEQPEKRESDPELYELFKKNILPFYEHGFPSRIFNGLNKIEQKIIINSANVDVTQLTSAEMAQKVKEQKELYEKLAKDKGQKINATKEVAKSLKIDPRQVQKYNNINKLIPELQDLFSEQAFNINEGATLKKLSEEEQLEMANKIRQLIDTEKRKAKKEDLEEMKFEIKTLKEKEEDLQQKLSKKLMESELLEKEKNSLLEKAKTIEEQYLHRETELQIKIEEEKSKNQPDQEKMNALQNKLNELNQEKQKADEEYSTALSTKEAEINQLKEKLQDIQQTEISEDEKKKLKIKMQLEIMHQDTEKRIADLHTFIEKNKEFLTEDAILKEEEQITDQINKIRLLFLSYHEI